MSYTSRKAFGSVELQTITSLDDRVIKGVISVKIPNFRVQFSEVLLDCYAQLAFSGTKKKTEEIIEAYLRQNGISLEVTAHSGYIHYQFTTKHEFFNKAITLIDELIYESTFPVQNWKRVKKLMGEENREAHDDAKLRAEVAFINLLYPKDSHLRADTLVQKKAHIRALQHKDMKKLHQAIQCGEWSISIVTSHNVERAIHTFTKKLKHTASKVERVWSTEEILDSTSIFNTIPGKTNIEVRIGNRMPISPSHPDYLAFVFGLNVLGKVGGFSGRLMSTVREKEGLTYGIYAKTSHFNVDSTGHWHIFTFFTARDLKKGIEATMRELQALIKKGITSHELIIFKEILKNQFLIAHESNARRLMLYHSAMLRGEDENRITQNITRMQKLTLKEVNEALRKYIKPESLIITGAGPVTSKGIGIIS